MTDLENIENGIEMEKKKREGGEKTFYNEEKKKEVKEKERVKDSLDKEGKIEWK